MATGGSNALAVYWHHPSKGVFVRRTADGGATWAPAIGIGPGGTESAVASRGSTIGVAWTGSRNRTIRFRRSIDGGLSFEAAVKITSQAVGYTVRPAVSIGPAGVVAVAWVADQNPFDESPPGKIKVRVSTDGGQTFGPQRSVVVDQGIDEPSVAVGNGVIYVAYSGFIYPGVLVRTSYDQGVTWTAPKEFANFSRAHVTGLVAEGSEAYLSYFSGIGGKYRRTTDKGQSWSGKLYVASASYRSSVPVIAFGGPHVVVTQWVSDRIVYRQSEDGVNWSAPQTVWSPPPDQAPVGQPGGVAYAGRPLVVFYLLTWEPQSWDVFARAR